MWEGEEKVEQWRNPQKGSVLFPFGFLVGCGIVETFEYAGCNIVLF